MANYLFPRFLEDRAEYRRARDYWAEVWSEINPVRRLLDGWSSPWMTITSPEIEEGNPIFSAVAPALRKGIRIIQYAPASAVAPLTKWIDTFGGAMTDPESIVELVIACVPSPRTVAEASKLMNEWVEAGPSWALTLSTPEVSTALDINALQALPA